MVCPARRLEPGTTRGRRVRRAVLRLARPPRRLATEPSSQVAEADGNRTRQAGDARLNGFEDRGAHQDPDASVGIIPVGHGRPAAPALAQFLIDLSSANFH
jgi:hypothetical protein